jgi:Domain of unknown function (DUF2341)
MNQVRKFSLIILSAIFLSWPLFAEEQSGKTPAAYAGWSHSGSLYILTTPEGANLPTTASEEGFPVLVRLNKDFFDFKQAKGKGDDVRFTSINGAPLAYQMEAWDAAAGTATFWVRIPTIKGNARQEIKMLWGKADATSESSGAAVFNEANGFVSVLHMSDQVNPAQDEVGLLTPVNNGTTACSGMIGQARRFAKGQHINCGDKITKFPSGAEPRSASAWFRTDTPGNVLGWGKFKAGSDIVDAMCDICDTKVRNLRTAEKFRALVSRGCGGESPRRNKRTARSRRS